MTPIFLITVTSFFLSANSQPLADPYVTCVDNAAVYAQRSAELQAIASADQADREGNVLAPGAQVRDRERRQRVGAIFGEGCFRDARDYAAAALVYQHGDRPDHFFQTFLWSKRAVELGDASQKGMMARGIDRYLVNLGQKQLFATQYFKPSVAPDACWCLDKTEATFPDARRVEYVGKTYQQALDYLNQLNSGLNCSSRECERPLQPSPAGTVPGFW